MHRCSLYKCLCCVQILASFFEKTFEIKGGGVKLTLPRRFYTPPDFAGNRVKAVQDDVSSKTVSIWMHHTVPFHNIRHYFMLDNDLAN